MKKKKIFLNILNYILLIFLILKNLYSLVDYNITFANSASFASAGATLLNSTESMFFNPANLYNLDCSKFAIFYNKHFLGFESENSLNSEQGYYPVNINSYGISMITPITKIGGLGFAFTSLDFAQLSSLTVLFVNGSFNLNKILNLNKNLSTGISLKYFIQKYNATLWNNNSDTSSFISFDIGIFTILSENINFGFAIIDIFSTDSGISSVEKLPIKYRTGLSYIFKKFNIFADFEYYENEYNLMIGLLYKILKSLNLKAGINFYYTGFGLDWTFFENFKFNYAINYYFADFNANVFNHKISLELKF